MSQLLCSPLLITSSVFVQELQSPCMHINYYRIEWISSLVRTKLIPYSTTGLLGLDWMIRWLSQRVQVIDSIVDECITLCLNDKMVSARMMSHCSFWCNLVWSPISLPPVWFDGSGTEMDRFAVGFVGKKLDFLETPETPHRSTYPIWYQTLFKCRKDNLFHLIAFTVLSDKTCCCYIAHRPTVQSATRNRLWSGVPPPLTVVL
jgi:hypothetical protein